MREILFRGKRLDDGKWVYGAYSQYNFSGEKDTGIIEIPCIIDYDDDCLWCEIVPESVGQYTGLTDKNGKKIFEGDIVEADGYIFVVKFGKCGGVSNAENYGYMGFYFGGFDKITKDCIGYGLRNDMCYFTEREVIGNIHDNPELLEAK